MTQSEKVDTILDSLSLMTSEFIHSLPDKDFKRLEAAIGRRNMIISRISKQRTHSKIHFKPESK